MFEVGTSEYFREELLRFREFMGQKMFWKDLDKANRAMGGLIYVYANTKNLNKDDETFMVATTEEYDRRLAYIMCPGLTT